MIIGRPVSSEPADHYDELPYPSGSFALTHPWRLGLVGRCFGVATASPERARVLELGAGTGWNAAMIALSLPDAAVVAIDREARHVADGQALWQRLVAAQDSSRGNCHIRVGDFVTLSAAELGSFDYVIAHGVYGWIPPAARDAMMALAAAVLAPGGVFYLSTNVYPGSYARDAVRSMLLHRVRDIRAPRERLRVAREFLLGLAASAPEVSAWWSAALSGEADYIRDSPPEHLLHEHLAPVSDALHIKDLVAHARRHGLDYLADAQMSAALGHSLPDALRDQLMRTATDPIDLQQLIDFATGRVFRRALFVRAEDRPRAEPVAAPLMQAHFLSAATRVHNEWHLGSRAFEPSRWALHRALTALASAWPEPLSFAALHAAAGGEAELLAEDLLECWAFGFVDPLLGEPRVGRLDVGSAPRLAPAVPIELAAGHPHVTSTHHAPITLTDALQAFACLVDGQRDAATLEQHGPGMLQTLARLALIAPPTTRVSPPSG